MSPFKLQPDACKLMAHERNIALSKTIITEDTIEGLPQYVSDKSFQDTLQIILQSLSIRQWPSTETESRLPVIKTG